MANFDDITGWKEELAEFKIENPDPWIEPHKLSISKVPLELPYSTAYQLITLYLTDTELRTAIDQRVKWDQYIVSQGGGVDLDNPEDRKHFPEEAFEILEAFSEWYCQKLEIYSAHIELGQCAQHVAMGVVEGKCSSMYSLEAKNRLNKAPLLIFIEDKYMSTNQSTKVVSFDP